MNWHPKTRWDPDSNECWMADFKHLQSKALRASSPDSLTERARNYLAVLHQYRDQAVMVGAFAGIGVLAAFPDNRQPVGPPAPEPVYQQEAGGEHRAPAVAPDGRDSPGTTGQDSQQRRKPGLSCG